MPLSNPHGLYISTLQCILNDMHQKVQEFNKPLHHERADLVMVSSLLEEEATEYFSAVTEFTFNPSRILLQLAHRMDAVCDMLYVLLNELYLCSKYKMTPHNKELSSLVISDIAHDLSVPIIQAFYVVHKSNMSKMVDGVFMLNHPDRPWFNNLLPVGKVLKPASYTPVTVEELLNLQVAYAAQVETDTVSSHRMLVGDNLLNNANIQSECEGLTGKELYTMLSIAVSTATIL